MIGLAFGGGGVKGSYQIGSYLAFKSCGIKVDGVVGTSIGSFNAALIASHEEEKLYEFWKNADVGKLLNFTKEYVNSVNTNQKFKEFVYGIEQMSLIVKNKGIDLNNLKEVLNNILNEKKLRKSKIDYGLVTVRAKDYKPLYLFKKDMKEGKLAEYILASCNLPVFKRTKLIDDDYYIDGGFYDTNPVNMLLDKGYDKVYSIEIQGFGLKQKIKDKTRVVRITPSRFLGSTLNVNKDQINENIKLGYYDTLKVLKNYDGYNFIFKKYSNLLYNTLLRGIDDELIKKVKRYFNAKDNREVVIKALEYVMLKERKTYFNVYKTLKVIKYVRKNTKNKHFVYEFVRKLRLL